MSLPEYIEPKDQLRERLPLRYVCAYFGIALDEDGEGLCPFHIDILGRPDSDPSFRLYRSDDDTHDRWHCFPCGIGGDVFDLIARVEDLNFNGALTRARLIARDIEDVVFDYKPLRKKVELDVDLWEELLDKATAFALARPEQLAAVARFDASWGEILARRWGWGLSEDGWALIPHRDGAGKLTGVKLRHPDVERMISVPGSRYLNLYGLHRGARSLDWSLLAEGETDTIFADAETAAIMIDCLGVPGAGTPPRGEMVEPLTGRQVALAGDGDDAGRKFVERWVEGLRGVASAVWLLDVPEGKDLRTSGKPVTQLIRESRQVW